MGELGDLSALLCQALMIGIPKLCRNCNLDEIGEARSPSRSNREKPSESEAFLQLLGNRGVFLWKEEEK